MSKNLTKIYTDGCCYGTPGLGGWACIIDEPNKARIEFFGAMECTTNNRMEIMAVMQALYYLEQMGQDIIVYSDSQYVCNSIDKWMLNWEKKNFEGKKNGDLWKEMCNLKRKHSKLKTQWVRGHNGHPENERCDQLAEQATHQSRIPIDEVCRHNYLLKSN
jgi:ribonuclease HI